VSVEKAGILAKVGRGCLSCLIKHREGCNFSPSGIWLSRAGSLPQGIAVSCGSEAAREEASAVSRRQFTEMAQSKVSTGSTSGAHGCCEVRRKRPVPAAKAWKRQVETPAAPTTPASSGLL